MNRPAALKNARIRNKHRVDGIARNDDEDRRQPRRHTRRDRRKNAARPIASVHFSSIRRDSNPAACYVFCKGTALRLFARHRPTMFAP